ncbi:hypothetical protein KP509_1Z038400 [Ceratopteris richardii]|nr:hypothetical protein KP509_1Z038400 [Ceratopteris richardii]
MNTKDMAKEIVNQVKAFLNDVFSSQRNMDQPQTVIGSSYDVFICHYGSETKRNIVDCLCGLLKYNGITCFVDYEMKEGTDFPAHIFRAIKHSRVHIIVFSPNFAKSQWCLKEAHEIMKIQKDTSFHIVLPIFVDVEVSDVRYQPKGTAYDLSSHKRLTTENIVQWGETLTKISHITGFEWSTKETFQWRRTHEIVSRVQAYLHGNAPLYIDPKWKQMYKTELEQVQQARRSISSNGATMIGVYGTHRKEFSNLLVEKLYSDFHAWCILRGVMENSTSHDGLLRLQSILYRSLIQRNIKEPINKFQHDLLGWKRLLETRLSKMECLIVLDDIGMDSDRLSPLVVLDKEKLGKGSLVIVNSLYKHVLCKVVQVDIFIGLSKEGNSSKVLALCYDERDVHASFIDHLRETFLMHGLTVDLFIKENVHKDIMTQNVQVLLPIISRGFTVSTFNEIARYWKATKVIYISYGPHKSSMSSFRVNFEEPTSKLDMFAFRRLVYEVLQAFGEVNNNMEFLGY